ncbi:hypothetical protein [Commensalibacter oyaizuii]|uniref:BstA-like C-terminal domain-containing protein n=1 Tax=Commensalibacter oyaizuii TaxID=3043873 RepID=A0ABT6PZ76_9PROT|nr:hypothetical protein [Commensalibacter sp. TBRC 16381]MDI2090157.1 hypothetical protein [Commensalibacter sp. TBRC 16381]
MNRIKLDHQSAPKGFFFILNEAHTIICKIIQAEVNVEGKNVIDISIG